MTKQSKSTGIHTSRYYAPTKVVKAVSKSPLRPQKVWNKVKLMRRVDRYFTNSCPDYKVDAMLAVANTKSTRKFRRELEREPLYKHFRMLYGKKNFSPFKYGDKLKYTFNTGDTVTTSLSQMMFWKWCTTYDILPKYYSFV